MLYRINSAMLVSNVLTLDYSEKKGEPEKKYLKRLRENDDRFEAALEKCQLIGWKAWLRAMRQSEESMCKYFTNLINPAMPFTQLIVED